MSKSNTGVTVVHADSLAAKLDQGPLDGQYEVDVPYAPHRDTRAYDPIGDRGTEVTLTHPVADIEELREKAHLTVIIGDSNRDHSEYDTTTDNEEPSAAQTTAFDEAVLELKDEALAAEAMPMAAFPFPERHITAMLLYDARGCSSWQELADRLDEKPSIRDAVGYDSVPDQSTFWRVNDELSDAGWRDVICNAARRAVYAAERAGVLIPYAARNAHGLALPAEIDEPTVPDQTRRKAVQNWVEYLLPRFIDSLSFNRSENTTYTVRELVATVAMAALGNGVESTRTFGGWFVDESDIPTASYMTRLLGRFTHNEIIEMFTPVYLDTIDVAAELGFFDEPYDIALDPTWVAYSGEKTPSDDGSTLINNPKTGETGIGWCFPVATVMNLDARFTLGVDLTTSSKDTRTDQFRRMLRVVDQEASVGRIHIDREFYSGDAVRMCRAIAGEEWVIRVRRQSDGAVAEKIESTPVGESKCYEDVSFSDVTPDVNVYVHAIPEELQERNDRTHMAFITDLTAETASLPGIYYQYRKRWSVEVFLRQAKHQYLPETETSDGTHRLLLFNIAAVLYNIHTVINRAPSPEYALRVNASYYDVLLAVVMTTFTPTGPDGETQ